MVLGSFAQVKISVVPDNEKPVGADHEWAFPSRSEYWYLKISQKTTHEGKSESN
jgi:hypothetical protein